jgi:hypothetical protein
MRFYQWRKRRSLLLTLATGVGIERQLSIENENLNLEYSAEMNAPNQGFLHSRNTCVRRDFVRDQSSNIHILPGSLRHFIDTASEERQEQLSNQESARFFP